MAEIVNLRRFRKMKSRAEEEKRAEENRVRHGRPKAERERRSRDEERSRAFLEGHRREPGEVEDR